MAPACFKLFAPKEFFGTNVYINDDDDDESAWNDVIGRFVESQVDCYWSQLLLQGQEMALVTEAPEPPRSGPSRAAVEAALRFLLSFVYKDWAGGDASPRLALAPYADVLLIFRHRSR